MGNAPQAGFNASEHDRPRVLEIAVNQVRIDNHCSVRTPVVYPPGGIVIAFSSFLQRCIVSYHGVNTTTRYPPKQPRFSQAANVLIGVNICLGNYPNPVASVVEPFPC